MIALVPGVSRTHFPRLMDGMHELRLSAARARHERPSSPINRRTVVDYFDSLDPLYVIALDEAECVSGALRLLPTTGATMLNDAFAAMLPDGLRVESPLIWEASRLTLRGAGNCAEQDPAMDRTIGELGVALNAIARTAALSHLVVIYDEWMRRLLSLRGCAGETLAPPIRFEGAEVFAAVYEVGAAMDAQFRRLAGDAARDPIILVELEGPRLRDPQF